MPRKNNNTVKEGTRRSAYDGKPTREYRGWVNGREVVIHSSWQPGDADR